jgi:hypothetical protein
MEMYMDQVKGLNIDFEQKHAQYWKEVEREGRCNACSLNSDGIPDCMSELQLQLGVLFATRLIVMNAYEAIRGILWYKLM